VNRSALIARIMAVQCRRLFMARPMPELTLPPLRARERVA
jgi:hypothetical protein